MIPKQVDDIFKQAFGDIFVKAERLENWGKYEVYRPYFGHPMTLGQAIYVLGYKNKYRWIKPSEINAIVRFYSPNNEWED
jgi:hypothetical protein